MLGTVEIKVRPLRMAFLVDPRNKGSIREAIRINSTLWGGESNPIIPMYKKMPEVWADKPLRAPKAETVIKGYIDTFDPDIFVQCTKEVPEYISKIGLEIIKLEEIWLETRKDKRKLAPTCGIGIFELLNHIFSEHFKYHSRFPVKIVIPRIPRLYPLFWSSLLGEIPKEIENLIDESFKEALDIEEMPITTSKIKDVFKENVLFPRRITRYGLNYSSRNSFRNGACIFYMDAEKAGDIIDYWNLRAVSRGVLPVPKQFKDDLHIKNIVIDFLKSNKRSWGNNNPQKFDYPSFIRSRSVSMEEMEDYVNSLRGAETQELRYVLQHWYPRIWDEWDRGQGAAEPNDIFGEEKRIDLNDVKRSISFNTILPEVSFEHVYSDQPRCANDISFRFFGSGESFAQVFPKSPGNHLMRAIISIASPRDWRVGRHGLVNLVRYDDTIYWNIPLSQDVFLSWLQDLGWKAESSTCGLITKQMFAQLDGSVRPFANANLLNLFEHMNGGRISRQGAHERESETIEDEREIPVGEIKSRLENISRNVIFYNLHDYLISKNVFRVGSRIQCPSCKRRSWYGLDDLKEQLTCPKCTHKYLAIGNIDDGAWCYKTVGPFSIPRYADGAYCVLLAVDFFSEHRMMSLRTTHSYSFTAVDSKGGKLEADFAILWQESMFGTVSDGVVFGECKTFGEFKTRDFERMRAIARKFPGAILAFCTLRKELNKNEIKDLPIRPINFPFPEFQAACRVKHLTLVVVVYPLVTLTGMSADAEFPRQRYS